MHELQFMTNLIRMVEEVCKKDSRITPLVISLQVASYSHLAQHSLEDLQTMFDFVARNTFAQGAQLTVSTKIVKATCRTCFSKTECHTETILCPQCGSGDLEREDIPEVLIQTIKYTDRSL